ncbi:MAG: ATP-binding protein [Fimbriiglobus sp.]|nr:ATP-binding protein [Fimbriiglobus sp.]
MRGQEYTKRAMLIAAAGGHNVLLFDSVRNQPRKQYAHARLGTAHFAL